MKFFNNISKALVLVALVFVASSCEDEDKAPILTFEAATKGGYPRLLAEEGEPFVNLFDVAGSSYGYTIEFIDEARGANVESYYLEVSYNGGSSMPLRSAYSSSDFSDNANGYKELTVAPITAAELLSAVGVAEGDLAVGDEFDVTGFVVVSGNTFGGANSSATVEGAAFVGHFDYTFPVGCPSDLAGDYDYSYSSPNWCGGAGTGTITIQANGGGFYTFNDWSFNSYADCYGGGTAIGLEFQEVCNELNLVGKVDSYGDTWVVTTSITGNIWSIEYDNAAWGESGQAEITLPADHTLVIGSVGWD